MSWGKQSTQPELSSPNWQSPRSDQDLYARFQYPLPLAVIEKMRQAMERQQPGNKPDTRVALLDDGVRTGSGGGGGIACFQNLEESQAAIDSKGRVIPGQEKRIRRLYVYDSFFIPQGQFISPRSSTGAQHLLWIVDNFIQPANPTIAAKLKEALNAVHPIKWLNRPALQPYADTGEGVPGSAVSGLNIAECPVKRYVQLVIRYERTAGQNVPSVVLTADYAVLARLSATWPPEWAVLHEALLILHEALYMIAAQTGGSTSNSIRGLTAELLSADFYSQKGQPKSREQINQLLMQRFNKTFLYFDQFMSGSILAKPSVRLAAGSLGDALRSADQSLHEFLRSVQLQSPQISQEYGIWDLRRFPEKMRVILQEMSRRPPVQSFLFQARYSRLFHSLISLARYQVEQLYQTPNSDRELLRRTCQSLEMDARLASITLEIPGTNRKLAPQDTSSYALTPRALEFCQSIGLNPMTASESQEFLTWSWSMKN